jgi:hypothetical protein
LGVCPATSGLGGTHVPTGLYDDKLDQASVLANFSKALPETPGHERIVENVATEPLSTMMQAGQDSIVIQEDAYRDSTSQFRRQCCNGPCGGSRWNSTHDGRPDGSDEGDRP